MKRLPRPHSFNLLLNSSHSFSAPRQALCYRSRLFAPCSTAATACTESRYAGVPSAAVKALPSKLHWMVYSRTREAAKGSTRRLISGEQILQLRYFHNVDGATFAILSTRSTISNLLMLLQGLSMNHIMAIPAMDPTLTYSAMRREHFPFYRAAELSRNPFLPVRG